MIMTVDLDDGKAERGRLLIKWFEIVGLPDGLSLLQPVTVRDDGEPIKLPNFR